MKLKFHSNLAGALDDNTVLYLKCPECKQVSLWQDYPNNPTLSTVIATWWLKKWDHDKVDDKEAANQS